MLLWIVIRETNRQGVSIKHEALGALVLVFASKIRNSEYVSSLIQVSNKVKGIVGHASKVLPENEIELFASITDLQYSMLLLKLEVIDKAANIIHKTFIIVNYILEENQKIAVISF